VSEGDSSSSTTGTHGASGTAWNTVAGDHFELFFGYRDEAAFAAQVEQLVADRFASRLAAKDHTLWGEAAEAESARRLGWVDLPKTSQPLVAAITALRDELHGQGLTRVVLCGMGGSSLAPEVICGAAGVQLDVLDSSDPDFVRTAIDNDLAHTVVVVSSKSGGTVETDSQRRAYEKAFTDAGIDPRERVVVVTDPGSPLDQSATDAGYRVFRADPTVGGRFSALTAFGLVPSGLAGADIGALLAEAEAIRGDLETDSVDNPGLRLGALIGVANLAGVDKLVLCNAEAPYAGFGDWAEQLIAESTGKDGRGVLPVIVESPTSPNFSPSTPDEVLGSFGPGWLFDDVRTKSGWGVSVDTPLGAQLLLWEHATAVCGAIIGINPFDQPDVESAKSAARGLLDGGGAQPQAKFSDGAIAVYASPGVVSDDVSTVHDAIVALLARLDPERGYVAVQAYLDRHRDAELADVRATIAAATSRPVTFGWGPRFLHSTGQYHKGGPPTGVHLQITSQPERDLAVPDRPFTFHEFLVAQAVGDGQVLAEKGRPVLRLHLDSPAHLDAVRQALA
jgi:glucose-6-phosphate isomerase